MTQHLQGQPQADLQLPDKFKKLRGQRKILRSPDFRQIDEGPFCFPVIQISFPANL